MYRLGKIVMYSAEDICAAFHVTKETAYKVLAMPKSNAVQFGRKVLISEENLLNILSTKNKI